MGNFVNLNDKNENMLRNIVSIISLEEEEKKLSSIVYDKFKNLLLANDGIIENDDDEPCLIDRYHFENENETFQFEFCNTYIAVNGVIFVYDYQTDTSVNLSSLRIKDQIKLYQYFYNAVNKDL